MAGVVEENEFVEEIAFLESMFGGTVSSSVIATVIESCDGNGKCNIVVFISHNSVRTLGVNNKTCTYI